MKNKIVFIIIFYEILEYACEFGLAYIVSRLVSFSLEGDTRQTVIFAVSLLLALLFITVLKHGLKVNISRKLLSEKQAFQMNMYRSMMKVNLYKISYGELRQRLGADTDTICDFRFTVIPTLVSNVAVMLAGAGMIAGENLILGVVLFALTWVQLVPVWVSNRQLDENQEEVEKIEEKLNSFFLEGYKGFVQIKLFQAQNWYLRRLKGIHEDYSRVGTTGEKLVLVQKLVFNVLDNLLTYGTYFLVGVLIFNEKLTVGAGVLIIAVAAYLFGSMDAIREYFNEKVKYKIALKKVNRFYEMVEGNQNDVIGEAEAGGIQTRKLSFTYDGGRVFNYSDIAVPDGRKVVLMGENGSGKSTLLFLLSGLLKPVAGSVRGTANVTALLQQEDKLGETCAMLLQEISRKKPVDDALFDSISKAFKIDYLNQSFDDLSGGQKKKFLLAVVMASKDRICILDEPTNALDVEAVEVLVKWLRECDKTLLVVSHDDRILNLGFDRLIIGDICHVEEKTVLADC